MCVCVLCVFSVIVCVLCIFCVVLSVVYALCGVFLCFVGYVCCVYVVCVVCIVYSGVYVLCYVCVMGCMCVVCCMGCVYCLLYMSLAPPGAAIHCTGSTCLWEYWKGEHGISYLVSQNTKRDGDQNIC